MDILQTRRAILQLHTEKSTARLTLEKMKRSRSTPFVTIQPIIKRYKELNLLAPPSWENLWPLPVERICGRLLKLGRPETTNFRWVLECQLKLRLSLTSVWSKTFLCSFYIGTCKELWYRIIFFYKYHAAISWEVNSWRWSSLQICL